MAPTPRFTLVIVAASALVCLASYAGGQSAPPRRNPVGVFLRCTGQDDPLRALEAVKLLGLDMVQVSKLPDGFYRPKGRRASPSRCTDLVIVAPTPSWQSSPVKATRTATPRRPRDSGRSR